MGEDIAQTYTPSRDLFRPIAPYDDLAMSPSGTLIGLIKSTNTSTKSLYTISESGDLLVDASTVGRPQILISGESNITALWNDAGKFYMIRKDGTLSRIDGIQ